MLQRFSVSLERDLLAKFDDYIQEHGYNNRSEAVRDLIRKGLVKQEWDRNSRVVGVVTLVYDHHKPQLQERVTDLQHRFYNIITSTTHVHMDHHNCLEVTIAKGKASDVQELAQGLIALRGVKDGSLTMSSTGGELH
ncbi:MAG TPA: nickel-responsive transcriptional regulator NikR [Desulfobacteraceae bacterium]|nr:nickel-responsive transcriptional regulator NikR [Desulfobacteraceae bacterium]